MMLSEMPGGPLGRKGQAELLEWLPRILLLAVAVVIVAALVAFYANRDPEPAQPQRAAYLYRIFYDGNIIMYTDSQTGRVFPGEVDMAKFTPDRLDKVFREPSGAGSQLASCLSLLESDGTPVKNGIICNDNATFQNWLPIAQAGLQGPGGATWESDVFPVTIKDAAGARQGFLNITIVRPNS